MTTPKKNNQLPKIGEEPKRKAGAQPGNQFAIGNSGREKKWASTNELKEAIDEYFKECDDRTRDVYDKQSQSVKTINDPTPYTIEGLCMVLDCERQTLLNYEKLDGYEEFFDTIKRAKIKIQRS